MKSTVLLTILKRKYYKTNLGNCKNSKESWIIINKLLNKNQKSTMINEIIVNGNKITGNENIANEFNNYFSNIGSQLAENLSPSDLNPLCYVTPGTNVFEFIIITRMQNWRTFCAR